MTNRFDAARLDPLAALASTIRRDGLTEAEVEEFMAKAGTTIAASAEADGDSRAVRAAVAAISRLPADQFRRARGILVDVLGPGDLTLEEACGAVAAIHKGVGTDGEILYTALRDDGMVSSVRVSVIVCGID